MVDGSKRIGEILAERGHVSREHVRLALAEQERTRAYLGRELVRLGYTTEEAVLRALASQLGIDFVDPTAMELGAAASLLDPELARKHTILPIDATAQEITVATSDPFAFGAFDDVALATGRKVLRALATQEAIREAIEKLYGVSVERMIHDLSQANGEEAADPRAIHDLQELADEPTVVNLVNLILTQAIQDNASDIHIEPFSDTLKVKVRIDGILHEMPPPPKHLHAAIVSRIKVMADMNIAERFLPQDGHIELQMPEGQVDIRVATIPTLFGESVVLRLLYKSSILLTLDELGASREVLARFQRVLRRTHGLCLVVGPTGCGKTTTLYAALQAIYTDEKKIVTIEDPVEYELAGVVQIPVRPKRGLSFATGLRSIVRQDPDIILVGEIRDTETADIAIRSSLTGHLVFSTLHTNDAPGAVTRLLDMGVEPYLIASSLAAALAQRLVRKVCPDCHAEAAPDPAMLAQIEADLGPGGPAVFRRGRGCKTCKGTGYRGRTGIFELLTISNRLQPLILARATADELRSAASGTMESLRCDGWRKVRAGVTTPEEVVRVTQEND